MDLSFAALALASASILSCSVQSNFMIFLVAVFTMTVPLEAIPYLLSEVLSTFTDTV